MEPIAPRAAALGIDLAKPPAERYEVVGQIAVGGMARIYLGRMQTIDGRVRDVVLKRLLPDLQMDRDFVKMFYDEGRIAAQLEHPGIGEVYELGLLDGSLFMSLELIRGVNLRQLHDRLTEVKQRMPTKVALQLASRVLDALSFVHAFRMPDGRRMNIVHRDVSPQNLMLGYAGEIKLVDFGVARAEGRLHTTEQGLIKGKVAYMAPEQLDAQPLDGRADLYSLGVLLYEVLFDRHPFFQGAVDLMEVVFEQNAREPSFDGLDAPPALRKLLTRALARSPRDRYADAAAMKRDVEEAMATVPTRTDEPTLKKLIGDLFAARIRQESFARRSGDNARLVESLRAEMPLNRSENSRPTLRRLARAASSTPGSDTSWETAKTEASEEGSGAFWVDPTEFEDPTVGNPLDPAEPSLPELVPLSENWDQSVDIDVVVVEEPEDDRSITKTHPVQHGAMDPLPAAIGSYRITDRLGTDTTAEVFAGEATGAFGFSKRVAIKRVRKSVVNEHGPFARAYLECTVRASAIDHPNVASIEDVRTLDGDHFLVREFVHGWDLGTVLASCRLAETAPDPMIACWIVREICAALTAAHEIPMVHGGLTPTSILLSKKGGVKVTNFGVKVIERGLRAPDNTSTLPYLSPETIASGTSEISGDIFSTGAIFWEVLTLQSLFYRSSPEQTKLAIQRADIPLCSRARPEVPPELDWILGRAMAKETANRYASARDFKQAIDRLVTKCDPPIDASSLAAWLASVSIDSP
jgi:serine/threonine protein kinase